MTQRKKSQNIGLLMIVVFSAVFLWALTAVLWPVPVVYADGPEIITITVTSNLETYFYDPGLEEEGGTVYFNNLVGEGGGQVITVTTTVSGSLPITLTGATAFGMTPISNTNSTGELGITYTIGTSAGTENGVLFTVTDSGGFTDTALITFTQDITDPTIVSPTLNELSLFLHADGPMLYYGDEAALFWVEGEAQDDGAGPYQATYSVAFESAPPDDELIPPLYSWEGYYAVAAETDYGDGTITVTVSDLVGNSATQIFTYTRDTDSPDISYGSPPIVENSPHDALYADETTVYYSDQMGGTAQSFTVQGNAADNSGGAGLDRATFSSPHLNNPGPDNDPAEWSGTYNVDSSESGSGTITVRVYDNVSNWSQRTFNYVEDTTAPTVVLTDVTDPGYDENTNELDTDGSNWYNAGDFTAGGGGGWAFTSDTDDDGAGLASGTAAWDHSNNDFDRPIRDCGPDGDGIFLDASGDGEGTVTVTVTIADHVGNSASDTVVFNIDNTEPTITSPYISEDSDYLYRADDLITIYYGDKMTSVQTFTVNGSSNDTGVGLDRAEFSGAFGTAPVSDTTPSTWSGNYYPDNQDWGNGTITVKVSDWLGNAAYQTFYYYRDITHPTVDVTCPPVSPDPSWSVSWDNSSDPPPNASGLKHFDVQYKVESGDWQDWHTDTSLTEDTFGPTSPVIVEDDHTYYFRVRAEDNVSNESPYTNGQDATTYHSGIKKVFLPILIAPDPNWGFETGDFTNWQHGGQLVQSVSAAEHHSGNYSALLGNPSYRCEGGVPVGSAWLRRNVTVPSSGSPTLSFWYKIFTQDKNSALSDQYDLFAVYVNGSLLWKDANTSDPYGCGTLKNLGWQPGTISLNDYKGQTIQIAFYVYNRPDGWYNTYVYVDDVSVQ
jgi:hypothetical protein